MDFFKSNINSIKQNRNELYKKLDGYLKEHVTHSSIIIELEKARDGDKYILVQKDNALHRLNSSYSPKNEARKWVKQYLFTNINVIISLYGLGSGLFAREIVEHKGKSDMLIIYEPSADLFINVLHNFDITDIIADETIILSIEGINEFDFHQALRYLVNITNIKSQIKCTHPGYEELFPEEAIYFWKEIKDTYVHEKLNINTERFFGKRFITNSLYNARYIKDSNRLLDLIEYVNTDIPAIVVAAGPSLRENIDELRRAKGKAYVFVVDRILEYILDSGIEPDFIVTVDPIKPIEYFTKRTDVTVPLLCELVSNWEVLKRHKGRKIIYSCTPFFQKMYWSQKKEPPFLNTGASVATAAFSACVKLGFKRIVLVGQDLAYDGDLTHAGGIAEKTTTQQDVYVEGINGEKVRSRHDWYEFQNWFKDAIILNPDIEVIDTKAKGAKIEGAIQMSLKDVVNNFGVKRTDNNMMFINKKRTFDKGEMEGIRKYFSDSYEELRDLKRKAKRAIQICEEQIKIYSNNNNDNHITYSNNKRLNIINEYIAKQPVYLLLDTFITAETAQQLSEMYTFTEDDMQDKIVTYEKSISIYKAIIDGSDYAKKAFDANMEYI